MVRTRRGKKSVEGQPKESEQQDAGDQRSKLAAIILQLTSFVTSAKEIVTTAEQAMAKLPSTPDADDTGNNPKDTPKSGRAKRAPP